MVKDHHEHAAMQYDSLGVKSRHGKIIARIHETNLKNKVC